MKAASVQSSETMRIVMSHTPGDTRVEAVPLPQVGPGDALLRVQVCPLASSGLNRARLQSQGAGVLGDGPVGFITEVGGAVHEVRVGDRVFVPSRVSCGDCLACQRGTPVGCQMYQWTHLDPGGFAEWIRVPAEHLERGILALPRDLGPSHAAYIDPLSRVIRAFDRARVRLGETVLIVGLELCGLLAVQWARREGIRCFGLDQSPRRRSLAMSYGAALVVDPARQDAGQEILDFAEGRGVDHAILIRADGSALRAVRSSLAPGGTVTLLAPPDDLQGALMSLADQYRSGISILGAPVAGKSEHQRALSLLELGSIEVQELGVRRCDLDTVPLELAAAHDDPDWIGTVVYPNGITA